MSCIAIPGAICEIVHIFDSLRIDAISFLVLCRG